MILLLTASFNCLNAQKNTEEKFEGTIGIGGGLDYGGLGFNLTGYADKRLAGFFGAGYNLAGLG